MGYPGERSTSTGSRKPLLVVNYLPARFDGQVEDAAMRASGFQSSGTDTADMEAEATRWETHVALTKAAR